MLDMAAAKEIDEHCHENGLSAIRRIDLERVKGMNYIPKNLDAYCNQYPYKCIDDVGMPLELTGDTIDALLYEKTCGPDPQIFKKHIKKCVILGDALYLDGFIDKFFVKCRSGTYASIFLHTYTVISNDPIVRQVNVGFIEIINKSRKKLTMTDLKTDNELFKDLFMIQPDVISFNVGLSDIMVENFAWQDNQVPGRFVEHFKELIIYFHTYFQAAGYRGAFCENLVYTFNLLPVYACMDSIVHNRENIQAVQVHSDLWGTSYHDMKREVYKRVADGINNRLHASKRMMFDKYNVVLLQPTPRWMFDGLHVNRRSGLPDKYTHDKMLGNFLYCLARVCCNKKICTLGIHSKKYKETDKFLHEGCAKVYLKEIP